MDKPLPPTESTYEPPRIEQVLTAEDLAREIQYAGAVTQITETQIGGGFRA